MEVDGCIFYARVARSAFRIGYSQVEVLGKFGPKNKTLSGKYKEHALYEELEHP